jgi:Mn-containing catalase
MTDKPEYIGLLNDIRLQEHRAGIYLKAWADKTEHPGLKGCLSLVAERETSHGDIFDRRIRELGGAPEDKDDPNFAERLRVAGSDMTDAEKNRLDARGPDPCHPAHCAPAL